jgi:EthD domain-containing protein
MITRLFFGPRRHDMTTEACLAHWRGKHAEIGARLPGVRAYVQNHGVLANGRFLLPYPGFDIMPELDWEDLASMDRAIDSPAHEQDSIDDEADFLEVDRTGYAVATRHGLSGRQPPAGAVKLITLLRRAVNVSSQALSDALIGPYARLVSQAGVMRHETLITLPDREGRPGFAVQAVDMLWFAEPRDALSWIDSDAAAAASWNLAGIAFGTERLIARPQKIV